MLLHCPHGTKNSLKFYKGERAWGLAMLCNEPYKWSYAIFWWGLVVRWVCGQWAICREWTCYWKPKWRAWVTMQINPLLYKKFIKNNECTCTNNMLENGVMYSNIFNLMWWMPPLHTQNNNHEKNSPLLQIQSTSTIPWENHWTFSHP